MKPSNYDFRELKRQEARLQAFKEKNFGACGYDASIPFFAWIMACSIFPPLLIAWFLWEWWFRFLRMTKIFLNQIILIMKRFNYGKLLFLLVFIFMVLFILANILK